MSRVKLFLWCVIFFAGLDLTICSDDFASDECGKSGYIFVATMDGNVTALDFDSGQKCWSIVLDPKLFISSTLSALEVWENGTQVWLVPSLDGSMFKYDKVKLEPLSFNIESLLKHDVIIDTTSSVMGGKFKLVYGLHRHTGEIFFKCFIEDCDYFKPVSEKDAVIVEEWVQSVHAVDTVTSEPRWHFRVVEIKVRVINDSSSNKNFSQHFHDTKFENTTLIPANSYDFNPIKSIKISLANGYAARINHSAVDFMWLYKTTAPLLDVWFIKDQNVLLLDAFSDSLEFYNIDEGEHIASLFLGSYLEQIYVKQSKRLKINIVKNFAVSTHIPYQAFCLPLTSQTKPDVLLPTNDTNALISSNQNIKEHGFYFFVDFLVYDNNTHCVVNFTFPKRTAEIFGWTLWFKSLVLFMALLIAVLCFALYYLVVQQCKEVPKQFASEGTLTEMAQPKQFASEGTLTEMAPSIAENSESKKDVPEFVSRFHKDFQLIAILGKGGFGVVMEVKNKIDDCEYAVKRIRIKTEKYNEFGYGSVMREVKALAKLDHPGIVRYFNSWIESPPKGWQELKDLELDIVDVTNTATTASQFSPSFEEKIKTKKNVAFKTPRRQRDSISSISKKKINSNLKISEKLKENPLNPFGDIFLDSDFSNLGSNRDEPDNSSSSGSWLGDNICENDDSSIVNKEAKRSILEVGLSDELCNTEDFTNSEPLFALKEDIQTKNVENSKPNSADECSSDLMCGNKNFPNLDPNRNEPDSSPGDNTSEKADSSIINEETGRSILEVTLYDESVNTEQLFAPREHIRNKVKDSKANSDGEFSSDPLRGNKALDIRNLCSIPDDSLIDEMAAFLHLKKINDENHSSKLSPMFINELQRYLFFDPSCPDTNHSEWSGWSSILLNSPLNEIASILRMFRKWIVSVLNALPYPEIHYHNLLSTNLYNILEEVNLLLEDDGCDISDNTREELDRKIGVFFFLKNINSEFERPLKFIYLIKLRHYMFCQYTLIKPKQCAQPGWTSIFYRADIGLFEKNLELFQAWIFKVLFKINNDQLVFLDTVGMSLSYILSDVTQHLELKLFEPAPADDFFHLYGDLLKQPKDANQLQGYIKYLVMFHNVPLSDIKDQNLEGEKKDVPGYLYIQMQLCQRESLKTWLDKNSISRDYSEIMTMFCQIVEAMNYVHNKGLMHRDLKPSNIYFSLEGCIKIGDFGLATQFESQDAGDDDSSSSSIWFHARDCGTELYMSPEQRSKQKYNFKTDIFPLGIILCELLVPFETVFERYQTIKDVRENKFPPIFTSRFPNELMLIRRLLDPDPGRRPTASEILHHPLCEIYL